MNTRIIFIEGLPGSGKTTYANRAKKYLDSKNNNVITYYEGDLHPIDLAWCSIIPQKQFNELLIKYSKYLDQIKKFSRKDGENYITAYTKIRVSDQDFSFYKDFEPYEIYQTNDLNRFKNEHLQLWKRFTHICEDNSIYIFECISLQNHINELILKFNATKQEIINYFNELFASLNGLQVSLFYIKQKNIDKTLTKTIEARRSTNKFYKDWIDLVVEYFERTKYGKVLGFIGVEGAIKYFKYRQSLELEILKKINISTNIFELDDDYDYTFNKMKEKLNRI